MGRIFYRLILRPLRLEPARTVLMIAAVALGVAVVLAIEMAGEAAAGSFRSSVETLAGRADFEVTAAGGVTPATMARLAQLPYALVLHPRIEDYAMLGGSDRVVPFIGVDMLSDALQGASGSAETFGSEQSIWVGDGLKLKVGERVQLTVNDHALECMVRGVVENAGEVVVMDLGPATRVLERNGALDRILIEVPPGRPLEQWQSLLQAALPTGMSLAPQGSRTQENRKMLAAFRWNLRVLSYIALVVGAFLIYNTISVSVVRRRTEVGILRAIGASRTTVLLGFLAESACLGLFGGAFGILLGRLMAVGSVRLVAATVESLYVSSTPAPIALDWRVAALGLFIGVGVALVSALAPAWEASRVAPVEAMASGRREHEARVHRVRDLFFAALLAGGAWLASHQGPIGGKPVFGYLAALCMVAASALAIPALVSVLARAGGRLLGALFGVEALLASRGVIASLRRTSVLVAALSTAVAMLAAVGIMVGSFRETVVLWMEDRLQADLYLRPAGPAGADRHPTMSADIAEKLRTLTEIADVDMFRAYDISYDGLPAIVGAGEARIAGRYGRRPFLSGTAPGRVFAELEGHDNVIVSEPFAYKHRMGAGDVLTLSLGGKPASFHVIDVYNDYSNERGYIIMDRGTLLKYLPDRAASNAAVYLKPGVSLEDGRRAVESALAHRRILVFTNRSLREEAIRVFDRTFAITYALEAVAVFVAVMGVAGALLALIIDRRREFGLLRFLGASTGQVRRIIFFEAGLLGLLANVAGIILGFFLSLLLIFVINRQSFGWTIQFHWPVAVLLSALSIVYLATILAAVCPARMAARLVPIEVIHED